jgi:hypothetical protein
MTEENMSGGERSVPAQFHFDLRSHPAKIEKIILPNDERGFREIVLGGNGLHQFVRQPLIEKTNARWIAPKNPVRKSENLKIGSGVSHRLVEFLRQ